LDELDKDVHWDNATWAAEHTPDLSCNPQQGELELIHIPKTAGSTLEALGMSRGVCWGAEKPPGSWGARLGESGHKPIGPCPQWHIPRRFWSAMEDPYQGKRTFCVVRHPYTRAISRFLMDKFAEVSCKPDWAKLPTFQCSAAKLNEWVIEEFGPGLAEAMAAIPDATEDANDVLKPVAGFPKASNERRGEAGNRALKEVGAMGMIDDVCHLLPQWLFAVDRGCDVTLRYENLEAEFAALADSQANLRGLRLSQMEAVRANPPLLGVTDLNATSRALLARAYWRDFSLLNYSPAEGMSPLERRLSGNGQQQQQQQQQQL
jgi:hypothetical protein